MISIFGGSSAWNSLPTELGDITDSESFKKRLENVLFYRAFDYCATLLDILYSGALQIPSRLIDRSID